MSLKIAIRIGLTGAILQFLGEILRWYVSFLPGSRADDLFIQTGLLIDHRGLPEISFFSALCIFYFFLALYKNWNIKSNRSNL
nr:hypothetical protein DOP62_12390 [Synechococcus elongatus PCC 11801]